VDLRVLASQTLLLHALELYLVQLVQLCLQVSGAREGVLLEPRGEPGVVYGLGGVFLGIFLLQVRVGRARLGGAHVACELVVLLLGFGVREHLVGGVDFYKHLLALGVV